MDIIPQRQCKHCHHFYILTSDNFYTFRNRSGGLSFRHTCKQCFDENAKGNYRKRLEYNPEYERERYQRRKDNDPEYFREYGRVRYWRDPDKYNAYQKEYRERDIEKSRKQGREGMRRLRANDPEKYESYRKFYWETHRELYRLASRKNYRKYRQQRLEYAKTHKPTAAYRSAYNKVGKARYRARLAQAEGSHTAKELRELLEWQDYKCLYCGADLHEKYSEDHYYPLSCDIKDNSIHNIVLACISCNSRKQDKLPFLFDNRCM